MKHPMAGPTFAAIRKDLVKHDRTALVALIAELYLLNHQNRDFLDARFAAGESTLKRYKEIIDEALYPDVMSSMPVSFRDARKAISDFRKAKEKREVLQNSSCLPPSAAIALPATMATYLWACPGARARDQTTCARVRESVRAADD